MASEYIKLLQSQTEKAVSDRNKEIMTNVAYSTLAPLYYELDVSTYAALHSKLLQTGVLEEGGLEQLMAQGEDGVAFVDKMIKDATISQYATAEDYLLASEEAFSSRYTDIDLELQMTTEGLSSEEIESTMEFTSQILEIGFSMRVAQANEIYGVLPEKYAQMISYEDRDVT